DDAGRWAATGEVDGELLAGLLQEPWLALPPPKSTGRDLFNAEWLDRHLARYAPHAAPQDVQATLQRYTAQTVADAMAACGIAPRQVLVCGGGARNNGLMRELADRLP